MGGARVLACISQSSGRLVLRDSFQRCDLAFNGYHTQYIPEIFNGVHVEFILPLGNWCFDVPIIEACRNQVFVFSSTAMNKKVTVLGSHFWSQ